MPAGLPNNPRGFRETARLEFWRTDYDGTGSADLHVDVVFGEGRVSDVEISFRMRLRKAELRIIGDSTGVLKFRPDTLARTPAATSIVSSVSNTATTAKLEADVIVTPVVAVGAIRAHAEGKRSDASREVSLLVRGPAHVQHSKVDGGYAFTISSWNGDPLQGNVWDAADRRRIAIRDPAHPRPKGEPPEPRAQLFCKRDDLIIDDLVLHRKGRPWTSLGRNRQAAVLAYIRDEVAKLGGDVTGELLPFTELLLADCAPEGR